MNAVSGLMISEHILRTSTAFVLYDEERLAQNK